MNESLDDLRPAMCRSLAEAVVTGLTEYANMLEWLDRLLRTDSEEARDQLAQYATGLGIELTMVLRLIDLHDELWSSAPETEDPRPVLPLARALAESYVVLLAAETPETASRLPLVTLDRTQALLDADAHRFLAVHAPAVPKLVDDPR